MATAKTILVIDDDAEFARSLSMSLQKAGYETVAAFDGIHGMQLARVQKPDLIIMDVRMPAGDGILFTERLKMSTQTWSIPVIIVSGFLDDEVRERSRKAGASASFAKPIDFDVLLPTVADILAGKTEKP